MTTNLKYQKSEMPKSDQMTDHLKFQNVTCVDFGSTLTRLIVNVMQARKVAVPPLEFGRLAQTKLCLQLRIPEDSNSKI